MLTTIRRGIRDTAYPRFERASTAIVPGTGEEVGVNEPRYVGGNYSLRFVDGSDQYGLRVDGYPQFGRGDFTFEVWIKPFGSGNRTIFSRGNVNSDSGVLLRFNNDNTLHLFVVDDSSGTNKIISNDPLPNGQWSHVVITREGGVSRTYVNGQLKGTWHHEKGGIISPGNDRIAFGALAYHPTTARFDGLIARPRIYNVALTDQEVSARYSNQEVTRGLGLYYPLHEGQDTTAHDTAERINLLPPNVANGGEDGNTGHFGETNAANVTVSNEEAWEGSRSIKVVTDGSIGYQGFHHSRNGGWVPVVPGRRYLASGWVLAEPDTILQFRLRQTENGPYGTTVFTGTGEWQRVHQAFTATTNGMFIDVVTTPTPKATTFYIDGLMLQEVDNEGATPTPWTPPKLEPYNGTIEGAEFDQDNPFFEQGGFGSGLLVEEGTENTASFRSELANLPIGDNVTIGIIRFDRLGERTFKATLVEDITSTVIVSVGSATFDSSVCTTSVKVNELYIVPGSDGYFNFRTLNTISMLLAVETTGVLSDTREASIDNGPFGLRVSVPPGGEMKAGSYVVWSDFQVEKKPYPTSFTPGTRAPESLRIPTAGVLNAERGQIDVVFKTGLLARIPYLDNRQTGAPPNHMNVRPYQDKIRASLTPHVLTSTTSILPDTVYHLTINWGAHGAKLHLNGVLEDEGLGPVFIEDANFLRVGYSYVNTYFNGLLYGFRILSTPMSDDEIAAEYGKPLSVTPTTTYLLDFNRNLRQQQGTTYLPRFRGSQAVVL